MLGIFLALAVSRFVPHPPNFTSLIALSFYIPVLFGILGSGKNSIPLLPDADGKEEINFFVYFVL